MTQVILNFDVTGFGESAKKTFGSDCCILDCPSHLEILERDKNAASAIIVRLGLTLNRDFLKQFSKIKCIGTMTTGLDHIDLKYCEEKDIRVISLRGEAEFLKDIRATAEMTWALLLSLIRKIPTAFDSVKMGKWERENYFGHELYGRTMGIVGFGRLGQIIGRYAHAFGMKILAHDIQKIDLLDYSFEQTGIEEVFKKADVVLILLPLNETTQNFITERHFKMMKPGASFINTARGNIVDEKALLKALEESWISGAAVDVIADETIQGTINQDHPLIKYASTHQNLIITPHVAGSTIESMEKTSVFIAQKMKQFFEGIKSHEC